MKVKIIHIGSISSMELQSLCNEYTSRLKKYARVEILALSDIKNSASLPISELKKKEWALFSSKLSNNAVVILLDEQGKSISSVEFSEFIAKQQLNAVKELCFIIGGAYGFSEEAYAKASGKISLSRMTFSHQMVRLIFLEQLYRAFTILKGEKYHH